MRGDAFVSGRLVGLSTALLLAGLVAGRANAAAVPVYLWVTDSSGLIGYGGTNNNTVEVTQAAPSGGQYFSVTTYGTSNTDEYVAVSDVINHTLTEYLLEQREPERGWHDI